MVTNAEAVPDAVLIRSLEPMEGLSNMLQRTGKQAGDFTVTKGPRNLCGAMGIGSSVTGKWFQTGELYITADGLLLSPQQIAATKRIGIDGAGEDAALPFRFFIKDNKYVSAK